MLLFLLLRVSVKPSTLDSVLHVLLVLRIVFTTRITPRPNTMNRCYLGVSSAHPQKSSAERMELSDPKSKPPDPGIQQQAMVLHYHATVKKFEIQYED